MYIFGDKVATHTGTLRRRTIIIEDKPLAQLQRSIFLSLWNDARGPLSVDIAPCSHEPPRLPVSVELQQAQCKWTARDDALCFGSFASICGAFDDALPLIISEG